MVLDLGDYYRPDRPTLQQGDLVLAPLARFELEQMQPVAGTHAAAWSSLDELRVIWPADAQDSELAQLQVPGGHAVAMVTTHDCQLDRELLDRVTELRGGQGMDLHTAVAKAESEPSLDQFVCVSPYLPIDSLRSGRNELMANHVLGFFPVPAHDHVGLGEGAIDLTYRSTVDRRALARYAVLTESARTALRYALARIEPSRTPAIGFELEDAVGKRIRRIWRSDENPAAVVLDLSDGEQIELLMAPTRPRTAGAGRVAKPPTPFVDPGV